VNPDPDLDLDSLNPVPDVDLGFCLDPYPDPGQGVHPEQKLQKLRFFGFKTLDVFVDLHDGPYILKKNFPPTKKLFKHQSLSGVLFGWI
jgi:hypothetical protein